MNKLLLALAAFCVSPLAAFAAPKVITAAGVAPADITAAIAAYRAEIALGGAGNTTAALFPSGFRNVNWDGAPDTASSPHVMPADFFNSTVRRGVVFTTPAPGATLQLSADSDNPAAAAPRFANIDSSYATRFKAFTEQRLFAAVGSTIIDTAFFVPGSPATPATVNGMGVVFCDVDLAATTSLEFFDASGKSLGRFFAPVADNGLSFLGVSFPDGERVARVRVTHGNLPLAPGNVDTPTLDVVATDDFMFSEPLPLHSDAALVNISHRARVGTGDDVSITGFVVAGTQPKTFLLRVAGPALSAFGVSGALANPQLTLMSGAEIIATNDDWGNRADIQQAWQRSGAFPFAPGSLDAAALVVLAPGAYTVLARGANNTAGLALTEVYEVP